MARTHELRRAGDQGRVVAGDAAGVRVRRPGPGLGMVNSQGGCGATFDLSGPFG